MITSVENTMARPTCRVMPSTSSSVMVWSGRASRIRRMDSVTTIAPSTITPKSIAPSENRLAGMPSRLMMTNTVAKASGMVMAATMALRGLQKQNENNKDQPHTFHDGMGHFFRGGVNQIIAVQIGDNPHALWLKLLLQGRNTRMKKLKNVGGILACHHGDNAFNGVGVGILAQNPFPHLMPQLHTAQFTQENRTPSCWETGISPISSSVWIMPTPRTI